MQTNRPWRGLRPWERHSLVLVVAGLVYVGIGLAYVTTELPPPRAVALDVAINMFSIKVWGYVFVAAGVSVVISSKWPPWTESWGYMVLTGLSAGWAGAYGLSMIIGNSPISNLSALLVWSLVAFLWWSISGLLNPARKVDRVLVVKTDESV